MRESIRSVDLIDKPLKIPTVKSSGYNTNYIFVLISVLCPDGIVYICKNMNILEIIWAYQNSAFVGLLYTWSENKVRQQAELKKTLQKFVKLCVKIVGLLSGA
jgi:hypothetical protein